VETVCTVLLVLWRSMEIYERSIGRIFERFPILRFQIDTVPVSGGALQILPGFLGSPLDEA
jgi:hypothetical protein